MRVYLGKVISSFFPWDLPFFFPDGNVLAAAGHSSRYFYLALISFVLCNLLPSTAVSHIRSSWVF